MPITLRAWQQHAWKAFKDNNYRGLIKGCVGSGKTMLGIKIIEELVFTNKILIVVPQVNLMYQWKDEILKYVDKKIINENDIGLYGDGYKQEKRIIIAVINSIRERIVKYPIIILDEAHTYLSDKNIQFFNKNQFPKVLALSATPEREDDREFSDVSSLKDIKVIYEYSQEEAIKNKDLCNYDIINIGIDLEPNEIAPYSAAHSTIKRYLLRVKSDPGGLFTLPFTKNKKIMRTAIQKRKDILNNARNKIIKAAYLILNNKDKKIIVFCENINTAKTLKTLLGKFTDKVAIYHSKIKTKQKKEMLKAYKDGVSNVIISVRALDIGFNVPQTDMGILLAGNKTAKQIIQRAGRILRSGKDKAILYQLYCFDTKERDWVEQRISELGGYDNIFWK